MPNLPSIDVTLKKKKKKKKMRYVRIRSFFFNFCQDLRGLSQGGFHWNFPACRRGLAKTMLSLPPDVKSHPVHILNAMRSSTSFGRKKILPVSIRAKNLYLLPVKKKKKLLKEITYIPPHLLAASDEWLTPDPFGGTPDDPRRWHQRQTT